MNQARAIVSSYLGVVFMAGIIFLAGGRWLYWQALLYLAMALLGTFLTHLLTPRDSDLAARRASHARSGEAWDRRLMGFYFLLTLLTFCIAGLDSGRFGWSVMPDWVPVVAAVWMLAGQLVFALARRENVYFTSLVQIEAERGHQVCSSGPYRVVRHPGYAGMALSMLVFPLVLGSYWALLPALLALILLMRRTQLEDRFLQARLPGYPAYAQEVRFKILPAVF